jgi:hypothetical protein
MATAEQVLAIEAGYLGSNGDKVRAWYPLPSTAPYCMAGQSMALTEAGIPTHFAYVTYMLDAYERNGNFVSNDVREAMPGDLVCFDWGGGRYALDHVAMIIELTETGAWTRNGNVNGGKWADLWFPFNGGGMAYIARPFYENEPAPGPGPLATKANEMFHMKNADGRDEYIALTEGGQVVSCWSTKPDGVIGPWMELRPGIAGSNLVAEYAADGRLCVTLAAMGELWGSWQAAPSTGPWCDWFRVNDLRALTGA